MHYKVILLYKVYVCTCLIWSTNYELLDLICATYSKTNSDMWKLFIIISGLRRKTLDLAQWALLALDKDAGELAPLPLRHLAARLLACEIKDFIGKVHKEIYDTRGDFNVEISLRILFILANDQIVLNLLLVHNRPLSLSALGFDPALLQHLFLLGFACSLDRKGFSASLSRQNLLAVSESLVLVSRLLFLPLLLEKFLNQHVLIFLPVEAYLSPTLVNDELSTPTLSLLPSKVTYLLRLLNLVHRGWEGEVLDLTRWDSFFLFLLLYGVIHIDVLLNAKLLKVIVKFIESMAHLSCGLVELTC